MEAYTYSNIFDTKGIEYIIIIFFLLLVTPVWLLINRKSSVTKQIQQTVGALNARILKIPQGLFYSKNHTWLFLEKSGQAKIGIDDFLLRIVGEIKLNLIRSAGETVQKGEMLAEINQDGKRLKLFSPVSGTIVGFNSQITEKSGIMESDPYDEGWIYSMVPSNWKAETAGFYFAEEAVKWVGNELQRFKDFLGIELAKTSENTPAVIFQEGGELQMYPMKELHVETWNNFQKEFLDPGVI